MVSQLDSHPDLITITFIKNIETLLLMEPLVNYIWNLHPDIESEEKTLPSLEWPQ